PASLPSCEVGGSAAFARLDGGSSPRRALARRAPRSVAAQALALFKKLPQWRMLTKDGPGTPSTVEMDLALGSGKLHLVALAYDSATPSCGTWALWKVSDEDRRWELLNDPSDFTYFRAQLATDLDADGKPELFGDTTPGGSVFGLLGRSWSASDLRALDGSEWIPWEQGSCER